MDWVLPGVELVLANFFLFTRVLMREDLPTLDLPAKAISGLSDTGYWLSLKALIINSTSILPQGKELFDPIQPLLYVLKGIGIGKSEIPFGIFAEIDPRRDPDPSLFKDLKGEIV